MHNPLRLVGEAVKKKIENRRTRARARAALFVTGRAVRFAVLFTFRARRAVCQKAVPLCRAIREKIVSSPYAARVLFPCRAGVAGSSFSPSHLAPPCPPLPPPPPSPFSNASSTEKKWSGKRSGRWRKLEQEVLIDKTKQRMDPILFMCARKMFYVLPIINLTKRQSSFREKVGLAIFSTMQKENMPYTKGLIA